MSPELIADPVNMARVTTSQLAKALIHLKGKPLSLDEYLPMTEIYDCDPPTMTVKASRQIGKTAGLGAILTLKSAAIPNVTSIYIAPLSNQASRFSTSYLTPYMNSPLIKKYFVDSATRKNVFEKTMTNGSVIYLSYCDNPSEADRTRGIPGDILYWDEVQDVQYDTLGVVYEALSASEYGWKKHFGTAKTEQNTLEILFKQSNGLEWAMKCDKCSKYSIPWTFEDCLKICANKIGPCCVHCGALLNVKAGTWVAARPENKRHYGFHVPRFILPARVTPKKWEELREKMDTYTPGILCNEVFGLASGVAGRILSQREAVACCDSTKTEFDKSWTSDGRGILNCVLGVDWSITGGVASYTVATVLGYDYMGKCHVMYSERMQGTDIFDQVRRVAAIYREFNCQMIGADRGCGIMQCQSLKQTFGEDKVVMVQYCAAKTPLRGDRQGGFIAADRTQAMDMIFMKMKMGRTQIETPSWEAMSLFWPDALSIFEEESLSGRRLYRKDEGMTDDWFHSIVFGHIGWMVNTGQIQFYQEVPDNI